VTARGGGGFLLSAVAVHLVSRAVCLAALAAAAAVTDRDLAALVTVFDGAWYQTVATDGYPRELPLQADGTVAMNSTGFFPLYPLLARGVTAVTGLGFAAAAVLVSTVAGACAAALVALCVRHVHGPRVGLWTAALWSLQPTAFLLSLAYSEALFTALAAGTLLALLRGHWASAGLVAALATATRPTGVVLAVVAAGCAAVAVARHGQVRALLAPLLAPLGLLVHTLWLAQHTGRYDAYSVTQREGWDVHLDGGRDTASRVVAFLAQPSERPLGLALVAVLVVSLVLLVLLLRDRPPLALALYGLGMVALGVATHNAFGAYPRFLLPAFVLLVPLAARLAPRPRLATALAVLSAVVMAGAGVYVTTVSSYNP